MQSIYTYLRKCEQSEVRSYISYLDVSTSIRYGISASVFMSCMMDFVLLRTVEELNNQ